MDRGAWRATVHGVTKSGHDRSDLAHTRDPLRALMKLTMQYQTFKKEKGALYLEAVNREGKDVPAVAPPLNCLPLDPQLGVVPSEFFNPQRYDLG